MGGSMRITLKRLITVGSAVLIPALGACGKTATTAVGVGAAAAAAMAYNDRGVTSKIDASVKATADATESAFRALGITKTDRKIEEDGIEVQGRDGEWKVIVDIERDAGDTLSEIEVTVSKDEINYSKDRAERVLRGILQRL
jgi:hypothetical protein